MSVSTLALRAMPRPGSNRRLPAFAGVGLAMAALAAAAFLPDYYGYVLAQIALLAIAASGLNLLIGLGGQISFGHAGFYALGAYTVAVLTTRFQLDFWLAWPLGAVLAATCGGLLALPALRVKGPYLAMVTIAFGLIVEHALVELRPLTGGHNGILGVAGPAIAGMAIGQRGVALLAVATAIAAVAGFEFISRGPLGAALRAVRDSEAAAESIGLDPVAIRTAAFAASAFAAGLAGGLFPPLAGFVTPGIAGLGQSITLVLVVIVGGAGFGAGPLVGALIVGVLPEVLSGLESYRALAFGTLLLLVLWIAPRGITGLFPARRPGSSATPAAASRLERLLLRRERLALSADGLTIAFGGVKAATEVSLSFPPGRVTSLIGPNGAGKSTVLNLLSGFYRPDTGERRLGETILPAGRAFRTARTGVARTFQHSQLFASLSVAANVAIAFGRGALRKPRADEDARALLLACGYRGDPEALAGDLPHVDRRLVEIARALATNPDTLLLDEPAAGLGAEDKQRLGELLRQIAGCGVAVGLVEHDMDLVMGVSDQVAVLSAGRVLAEGAPQAIQAHEAVRAAYLGGAGIEATGPAALARPSSGTALSVRDLFAGYGAGAPVLRGLSMTVAGGEIVAVLGPNGAGKTTLMRTLAGLHAPLSGDILLEGGGRALNAAQAVGLGLALVSEGRQVFPEMTVRENLLMGGFARPAAREDAIEDILQRFPALKSRLRQRAGLLSGGEQQMLALGRALMSRPRVLLLDEPSLGLAPRAVEDLYRQLQTLNAQDGVTIVLVDQVADLALRLATRAYVLQDGVMAAEGSSAEIARSGALERAYLGAIG